MNDKGDELFKLPLASTLSKESYMAQDQGITREGRGEEQPKDKERAQTAHNKTDGGHTSLKPVPEQTKDRKQ